MSNAEIVDNTFMNTVQINSNISDELLAAYMDIDIIRADKSSGEYMEVETGLLIPDVEKWIHRQESLLPSGPGNP